mmetsp:Transcript_28827/g.73516  ORF Transcript_28827/g.73516 Transcript_28827/m.73516 type:complete len:200 (-) Transcript_28827:467-1066(-)
MAREVEEQRLPRLLPRHEPLDGAVDVHARGEPIGVLAVVAQDDDVVLQEAKLALEQVRHALHVVDAAVELGLGARVGAAHQHRLLVAAGLGHGRGHRRHRAVRRRRWVRTLGRVAVGSSGCSGRWCAVGRTVRGRGCSGPWCNVRGCPIATRPRIRRRLAKHAGCCGWLWVGGSRRWRCRGCAAALCIGSGRRCSGRRS